MVYHFHAENQKKLMIQSREKSKKPHFGPFFGPNLPKKFFFQKSGSVTVEVSCRPITMQKNQENQ